MRLGVLVCAGLTAATLAAPLVEAHESCAAGPPGGGCGAPHAMAPVEPPDLMADLVPAGRGVVLGHRHDWRHETPWHYHPAPYDCPQPYCLPSYHRHRERVVLAHPLPVAVVLKRLAHLDYGGFTAVLLDGANYQIDARNRYGRAVRLVVSAGTGLVRQQIVLPTY
jgi:hypothetical protein